MESRRGRRGEADALSCGVLCEVQASERLLLWRDWRGKRGHWSVRLGFDIEMLIRR